MKKHRYITILLETGSLTVLFFFVDVLGKHEGFFGYSFNPYWITIFLASVWWGLDAFLLTSVEFIITLMLSFYCQKMPLDPFTFSTPLMIAAIFGALFGLVGEVHKRRMMRLEHELEEKNEKISKQEETIEEMHQTLERLKEDLFLEGSGLSLVFQRLRELEVSDVEEMFSRFVEVISDVFGVKSMSIYKKNGDFLRFFVGKGRRYMPNSLKVEDSLVIKRAFKKGMALISDVLLSQEIKGYEPWIAVLIGEPDNNDGIIVIEDIDKLSHQFVDQLHAIAQWFHANIENAKLITSQTVAQHRMQNGTWDMDYYEKMKKVYSERKERFEIPYSELCLEVNEKVLESVIHEFRRDDFATIVKKYDGKVVLKILLSVCDEKNKELISNRIESKYEKMAVVVDAC
jgi:uncharacterized coiled-coil protein SlyX